MDAKLEKLLESLEEALEEKRLDYERFDTDALYSPRAFIEKIISVEEEIPADRKESYTALVNTISQSDDTYALQVLEYLQAAFLQPSNKDQYVENASMQYTNNVLRPESVSRCMADVLGISEINENWLFSLNAEEKYSYFERQIKKLAESEVLKENKEEALSQGMLFLKSMAKTMERIEPELCGAFLYLVEQISFPIGYTYFGSPGKYYGIKHPHPQVVWCGNRTFSRALEDALLETEDKKGLLLHVKEGIDWGKDRTTLEMVFTYDNARRHYKQLFLALS